MKKELEVGCNYGYVFGLTEKTGKMTDLYFTKKFISGHLKGIEIKSEKIQFTNIEDAQRWININGRFSGKIIKDGFGGGSYVVTDQSFQNYKRS